MMEEVRSKTSRSRHSSPSKAHPDYYDEFRMSSPTRSEGANRRRDRDRRAPSPSSRSERGHRSSRSTDDGIVTGSRSDGRKRNKSCDLSKPATLRYVGGNDDVRPGDIYRVQSRSGDNRQSRHSETDKRLTDDLKVDRQRRRSQDSKLVNDTYVLDDNQGNTKNKYQQTVPNNKVTENAKKRPSLIGEQSFVDFQKHIKSDTVSGNISTPDTRNDYSKINSELRRANSQRLARSNSADRRQIDDDEYRCTTPRSEGGRKSANLSLSEDGRKMINIDGMKRKIYKLKNELDNERLRNRQNEENKEADIELVKRVMLEERDREMEELKVSLKGEKQAVTGIRDSEVLKDQRGTISGEREVIRPHQDVSRHSAPSGPSRPTDQHLQQVTPQKENKIKTPQTSFHRDDVTNIVSHSHPNPPSTVSHSNMSPRSPGAPSSVSSATVAMDTSMEMLQTDLDRLKRKNHDLEWKYKKKRTTSSAGSTTKSLSGISDKDYETELSEIVQDSKSVMLRDLETLKCAKEQLIKSVSTSLEDLLSQEEITNIDDLVNLSKQDILSQGEVTNVQNAMNLSKHDLPNQGGVSDVDDVDLSKHDATFTIEDAKVQESGREEDVVDSAHVPNEERAKDYCANITRLESQVLELEARVRALMEANEVLRSQESINTRPLEEKVKGLKKRNGELATIARQLEVKVKRLQQENAKKLKETSDPSPSSEHMKRMFAQQRAKDLADYAGNILLRDKEIASLQQKCQELATQITSSETSAPLNGEIYEDREDMINLVKQSAKERLVLEKQLSRCRLDQDSESSENAQNQIAHLTEVNNSLQEELAQLQQSLQASAVVEGELQQALEQITLLTVQTADLQQQCHRLAQVEADYAQLKKDLKHSHNLYQEQETERSHLLTQLNRVEQERDSSNQTAFDLQVESNKLEAALKVLQENVDQSQGVEVVNQTLLSTIQQKDDHLTMLEKNQNDWKEIKEREFEESQYQLRQLSEELESLQAKCAVQSETVSKTLVVSTGVQTDPDRRQLARQNIATSHNTSHNSLHDSTDDDVDFKHISEISHHPTTIKRITADPDLVRVRDINQKDPVSNVRSKIALDSPTNLSVSDKIRMYEAGQGSDVSFVSQSSPTPPAETSFNNPYTMDTSGYSPLRSRPPQIYIAKYSYDPNAFSPNDQPEAELPLDAGDYLVVFGEMDEDGFYMGELMDGRKGLVPSNFIEKVSEEDLSEFYSSIAAEPDKSIDKTVDTSIAESNISASSIVPVIASVPSTTQCIPFPTKLKLDRQLTSSILVSWSAPDDAKSTQIQAYHVYVDKKFRTSVHGSERTKALVEGVASNEIHRVSIRTVTSRGQSDLSQCTLLVGKGASAEPLNVQISGVTPNTANLSWLPGDSNCHHVIYLNGKEYRVLKPGTCRHEIDGLLPKTHYTLVLQARPHIDKITDSVVTTNNCRDLSVSLKFTTLAADLPSAPQDIQVEAGPQHGTLLLMWIPVTLSPTSDSTGKTIVGYNIYTDSMKVVTVNGPANDHVVLTKAELQGAIPNIITVRTLCDDGMESQPSSPLHLSPDLIAEMTASVSKHYSMVTGIPDVTNDSAELEDDDVLKTDEEPKTLDAVTASEMADDTSHSELSDIQEEEEEDDEDGKLLKLHQINTTRHSPQPGSKAAKAHAAKDKAAGKDNVKSQPVLMSGMGSMSRIVPAIEITRDSSSEKESSFDKQETDRSAPTSPEHHIDSPTHPKSSHVDVTSSRNKRHYTTSKGADKDKGRENARDVVIRDDPTIREDVRIRDVTQNPHARQTRDDPNIRDVPPSRVLPHTIHQSPEISDERDVLHSPTSQDDSTPRNVPSPRVGDTSPRNLTNARNDNYDIKKYGYTTRDTQNIRDVNEHDSDMPMYLDLRQDYNSADSNSNGHEGHVNPVPHQRHDPRKSKLVSESNKSHNNPSANPSHLTNHISQLSNGDLLDDSTDSIQELVSNNGFTEKHIRDDIPEHELIDYEDNGDGDSMIEAPQYIAPNQVRLFIALFDYDPVSMSPNIETAEEELPFKEGQLIKVYGDKDSDGFFHGEHSNRTGFVPCNMVSEVQVDDPEVEAQLLEESMAQPHNHVNHQPERERNQVASQDSLLSPSLSNPSNPSIPTQNGSTPRRMVALYDYDPKELSPNVDSELELVFKKGQYINVYGDMDEDGFYMGDLGGGLRGLVPSNFLQDLSPVQSDDEISSLETSSPVPHQTPTRQYNTPIQMEPVTNLDVVSPVDDKKIKKKGIFAKGKNIFKKLTR